MLRDVDTPESRALLSACALIDRLRSELRHVPTLDEAARRAWFASNELHLATLLLWADRADLNRAHHDTVRRIVFQLHKPLTGHVALSDHDVARVDALLLELWNQGFPCWVL